MNFEIQRTEILNTLERSKKQEVKQERELTKEENKRNGGVGLSKAEAGTTRAKVILWYVTLSNLTMQH